MLIYDSEPKQIAEYTQRLRNKFSNMRYMWLDKEIIKHLRKCRIKKRYEEYKTTFKFENNKIEYLVLPIVDENGKINEKTFLSFLFTKINGDKNKMCSINFNPEGKDVYVTTHHARCRFVERHGGIPLPPTQPQIIKYNRKGKEYELWVNGDGVFITKRECGNVVYDITFLRIDQCTDENYKKLLDQASICNLINENIDTWETYEWKENKPKK